MNEYAVIEGLISVASVIESRSREIRAVCIARNKKDKKTLALADAAAGNNIPVVLKDESYINEKACGKTHGGIIAEVGSRRYMPLPELIKGKQKPFIAMLDGIEDPYNFGYAVRALYAAGADGLVVLKRNWMSAANTVARASAGASELIPLAVSESLDDASDTLRREGLTIACTAKDNSTPVYDADLSCPLFLIIGGEKRGISRSFLDKCDILLQVPYGRTYDMSLAATSAAAVLAFEVMRQRRFR